MSDRSGHVKALFLAGKVTGEPGKGRHERVVLVCSLLQSIAVFGDLSAATSPRSEAIRNRPLGGSRS